MNMAIDDAIIKARIKNLVPNTLRFYRWSPSAVSIGKFQNARIDVDLKKCEEYGVNVVRRITGGGAVYHDTNGEITYSVIAHKKDLNGGDISNIYATVYAGIAQALKILGIDSDFNQGNEKKCPHITINGKKISGSSQYHSKGSVLQHGTLLVNVDLKRMFTFLRVPWATTRLDIEKIAQQKITSIEKERGERVPFGKVYEALIKGFQEKLKMKVERGTLTIFEQNLSKELCEGKYMTPNWKLA
jgi:lipoate-protein ligase A